MPRTCRPHGTPGNGGSNWTTPSPATTSASAVLLQARKVRSLAKVQRGSGSVPSSDLPGSVTGALPWLLVMIAAGVFAKKRWWRGVVALLHTGARGTQGGAGIWSPGNYHDPGAVRQLAWGGRLAGDSCGWRWPARRGGAADGR